MEKISDILKRVLKDKDLGNVDQLWQEVKSDPEIRHFLAAHKDEIPPEAQKTSLAVLYEFYNQRRHPDKVLAGYEPELFMNDGVISVRYKKTRQQQAKEDAAQKRKNVTLIDLPKQLRDVELDEIDQTESRIAALGAMGDFLAKVKAGDHPQGIYLSGAYGVGKTYILAGLANGYAGLGKKVIFLHVPTFIAGLSDHFSDNSLNQEINRVSTCDLLILDDIGAETLSQWSRDDVLGVILQHRMDNDLPTFFSSNLSMEELERHFAQVRDVDDRVKGARIMERVRYLAKEITVGGKNRRRR